MKTRIEVDEMDLREILLIAREDSFFLNRSVLTYADGVKKIYGSIHLLKDHAGKIDVQSNEHGFLRFIDIEGYTSGHMHPARVEVRGKN